MSIINSSAYVSGLVDYILDVKPYRTKLTEIIEEYQFYDSVNVSIKETFHSKLILSSEWSDTFVSDGYRTHWLIPDFNYPRYSIEANRHRFTLTNDALTHLISNYGIYNAYQLRASRGIESVIFNKSESLIEGIDYFVSKGMYSFTINTPSENRIWSTTNYNDTPGFANYSSKNKPATLITHTVGNSIQVFNNLNDNLDPNNLKVNFGKYYQDSFDITCISQSLTFEQILPAQTWTINHNFKTTNLVWEVFIGTHNGTNWDYPLEQILANVLVVNENTIRIDFSVPVSGMIHLTMVPDEFVFPLLDIAESEWVLYHHFNTTDIIVHTFVEQNDGKYHSVLPNSVEIINSSTIKIGSTLGINVKVILLPSDYSKTVHIPVASSNWTIPFNGLINLVPIIRLYKFDELSQSYIQFQPQSSTLYSDRIEIQNSTTFSGYAVLSTPSSEFKYSVINGRGNFLGYASASQRFIGRNLSFTLTNTSSVPGDSIHIARQHEGITVHPTAPEELWSLIKVNPISYGNVGFTSPETMQLVAVALANYSGNESTWTVTCTEVNASSYKFSIEATLIANGLPLVISVVEVNVPFEQLVDINVDAYMQLTFYPKRKPVKVGDYCTFTLGYEGSIFEKQLYDFDARIPDITDNFDFYDSLHYDIDNYYDLAPFVGEIKGGTKSPLKILPLGSAYSDAITETWTMTYVESAKHFTITGSTSGITEPAYLGKEYDNGLIRFRIISTGEIFDITKNDSNEYLTGYLSRALSRNELFEGDSLYFTILKDRPSYLVYGSVSGYSKPAVIGEYYWNGKIGFQLDLPRYEVSTITKSFGETNQGPVYFDNGIGYIDFNDVPKFDAFDERFNFSFHSSALTPKLGNPVNQYLVSSSLRGYLPAAILNERYIDIESALSSIDRNAIVDFTIMNGAPSEFRIDVITHPFKVFHSNEVLLLPEYTVGSVVVNTFQEDQFTINIGSNHPELGNNSFFVQTHITNAEFDPKIPDKGQIQDVWVSNIKDQKLGIIKREFDDTSGMFRQMLIIEPSFTSKYLPLNTQFNVKVRQADEYNDLVKIKFGERLSVSDLILHSETANVLIDPYLDIAVLMNRTETILSTFSEPTDHYDTVSYDTGFYDIYEPNITIRELEPTSDPENSVSTRIADFGLSIIMQHNSEDAGYDMVLYDVSGLELYQIGQSVYYQMPALVLPASNPIINVPYTSIEYQVPIFEATLEMPENGLFNFAIYSMVSPGILGMTLVEGIDYFKTQLNASNIKPVWGFYIFNSQPVTIVGFL